MMFGVGGQPPARPPVGPIGSAAHVLFMGDSILAGFPDASFRLLLGLETFLTNAFNAAGKTPPTYANTAVIGQTSVQMAADLTTQLTSVSPAPTDIFLCIGTNDIGGALTQAQTATALKSVLDTALATFPSVHIRVLSLLWFNEQWPKSLNTAGAGYDKYDLRNSTIQQVVTSYPAASVQWMYLRDLLYAQLVIDNPSNLVNGIETGDGTHPTKGPLPSGQAFVSGLVQNLVTLNLS